MASFISWYSTQFIIDSFGGSSHTDFRNSPLQTCLFRISTAQHPVLQGRQTGCSTISHETVKAVKRLITPCQVETAFILKWWNCATWENLGPATIYWQDSDRQWTSSNLKIKKNQIKSNKNLKNPHFLVPNEDVLSNIYGTKRKQGQTLTFTDTVISDGHHMIQARAGAKESQPLCLEEVLISQWPKDLQRQVGFQHLCKSWNPDLFLKS